MKKYLVIDNLDYDIQIQTEKQIRQLYGFWLEDLMQVYNDKDLQKDRENIYKTDINEIIKDMKNINSYIDIVEYKKQ